MDVEERIEAIFAAVGVTASLHVVDLDTVDLSAVDGGGPAGGGLREVGVRADEQVVIASIFKILLVLEFARQVEAGQLDPTERVVVTAADRLGGWGLAGCTDDAEVRCATSRTSPCRSPTTRPPTCCCAGSARTCCRCSPSSWG